MSEERRGRLLSRRMCMFYYSMSITNDLSRCHIFYRSRTLDLPDGLPKWSGMENASDQMDDHGNRIGNL